MNCAFVGGVAGAVQAALAFELSPFTRPLAPGQGEAFTFLGFTHAWSVSQRGAPYTRRQTASKKFTKGLDGIRDYCRNHRTRPLREQWEALRQRLRGHAQYFGIIGNSRRVSSYFYEARRIWRTWLNRRSSQRDVTWERFYREILPRFPTHPPRLSDIPKPSEPSILKKRMR